MVSVVAGHNHSCVSTQKGKVWCWGSNNFGQLGSGSWKDSNVPVTVLSPGSAAQISAGSFHTCALSSVGIVFCWGLNSNGQLGDGSLLNRNTPVLPILPRCILVSSGFAHSCALLANRSIACWGSNSMARFSSTIIDTYTQPVLFSSSALYLTVSCARVYTCAVDTSQSVRCWGQNFDSLLGVNKDAHISRVPVNPTLCSGAYIGDFSGSCVMLNASTAIVAASNLSSSLSGGSVSLSVSFIISGKVHGTQQPGVYVRDLPISQVSPTLIRSNSSSVITFSGSFATAASVGCGGAHSCAIMFSGELFCWGSNAAGQLGDRSVIDRSIPTSITQDIGQLSKVALGHLHSCMLTSAGRLACWGDNRFGQLGDNSTVGRTSPVTVLLSTASQQVSLGSRHTCALTVCYK